MFYKDFRIKENLELGQYMFFYIWFGLVYDWANICLFIHGWAYYMIGPTYVYLSMVGPSI